MKAKITKKGLFIPVEFFDGIQEVDIQKKDNLILLVPSMKTDPIMELGKNPIPCDVVDGSENLDKYIYSSDQ